MDNQYWGQVTDATARKQSGSMEARRFAFVNEIESRMRPQESLDNQPIGPDKLSGARAREVFNTYRARLQGTQSYLWGLRATGYDPYNTWPVLAIALNDLLFS